MKKITQSLLISLLIFPATLSAQEEEQTERLSINFATDSTGNVTPQIFIPLSWSSHFYSGLGYESGTTINIEEGSNDVEIGDYKFTNSATTNNFWMNILSYEDTISVFNYSIGALFSYKDISLSQFGYIFKDEITTPTTAIPFSNDRQLDVYQLGLYADVAMKNIADIFSFRLSAYLYPYTSLSLQHNVDVIGVLKDEVVSTSSQPLSYRLSADAYFKTGTVMDLSFSALFESEPLEYDAVNNKDFSSEYMRLRLDSKIVLSQLKMAGMDPMIGYGYERITSKDVGEESATQTNNLFLLGFEKKF